jgi:hypothetical protein
MKLNEGIEKLASVGLNIFLSAEVRTLPENLYPWSEEEKNKTLCLIGHGGRELWKHLPHPLNPSENPIDQFSIKYMEWFAENVLEEKVEILYPNEKYLLPLQQLGRFFNFCGMSPMGIDISPEFGPWFAFRGAFLTHKKWPSIQLSPMKNPCDICEEKPCQLSGRTACPLGISHQYTSEQSLYHDTFASQLALIHC